jgi:hypothetical protein
MAKIKPPAFLFQISQEGKSLSAVSIGEDVVDLAAQTQRRFKNKSP